MSYFSGSNENLLFVISYAAKNMKAAGVPWEIHVTLWTAISLTSLRIHGNLLQYCLVLLLLSQTLVVIFQSCTSNSGQTAQAPGLPFCCFFERMLAASSTVTSFQILLWSQSKWKISYLGMHMTHVYFQRQMIYPVIQRMINKKPCCNNFMQVSSKHCMTNSFV